MEVVTDASVLIAVISNESRQDTLVRRSQGVELIAPASVHWEVGNALSAMLKRKRITRQQAIQAITGYEQIPIRLVDVELIESLAIAAELDLYAYDAFLLRCAVKYRAPLMTLDRGLVHAAGRLNIDIVEVE